MNVKRVLLVGGLMVFFWWNMESCCFGQATTVLQVEEEEQEERKEGTKDYTLEDIYETSDGLLEHLEMNEIDEVIDESELPLDLSFSEMVIAVIGQKDGQGEEIWTYIESYVYGELIANKMYLVEILLLVVGFAILKNFAEVFDRSYISNVCFLFVYCIFMVLLMKSLLVLNDIVISTIQTVIDFMTAFIPVFATTLVFATGSAMAAGFYQLAYLIVYIMQWILGYFIIPLVRIYVIFGFVNYFLEEGKFIKTTELIETIIKGSLSMITSAVLGLNVMKTAIAPLTDSLTRNTLRRSLSLIPGVGNVLGAASDLFLTSGAIIKNGVGIAALLSLIAICMVPLLKIMIMTIMYKMLAAVVEPVSDKRICNALSIVSKGSGMLFRILTSCIILIFITVAMTTLLGQNI